MNKRFTDRELYLIRNAINFSVLMHQLRIPCKQVEGLDRFLFQLLDFYAYFFVTLHDYNYSKNGTGQSKLSAIARIKASSLLFSVLSCVIQAMADFKIICRTL